MSIYDMSRDEEDAYFQHMYEEWQDAIDEAVGKALVYLRIIPGRTINKVSIKEAIEIAHEADDPDFRFNADRLVNELIDLCAPDGIDWLVECADLHDFVYEHLEDLFPLTVR